jgi:hypothetical protein
VYVGTCLKKKHRETTDLKVKKIRSTKTKLATCHRLVCSGQLWQHENLAFSRTSGTVSIAVIAAPMRVFSIVSAFPPFFVQVKKIGGEKLFTHPHTPLPASLSLSLSLYVIPHEIQT